MILKNKLALITGANRGIGLSILKKFSENGADVIACARRKNVKFEQLILDISKKYKNYLQRFNISVEEKIKILENIFLTISKSKRKCITMEELANYYINKNYHLTNPLTPSCDFKGPSWF